MIRSFTVKNQNGEKLVLDLANPYATGLAVSSIDGLGPVAASINVNELATMDGVVFSSSRIDKRYLTLRLIALPMPTIEDTRHRLYQHFPVKKKVDIEIETDSRHVTTECYVESVEPNIFSTQEDFSISLVAPDPYFYDIHKTESAFVGVRPEFEFPFENNSLVDSMLEFGVVESEKSLKVIYEGDADTGMMMKMQFVGPATNITLYKEETHELMQIDTDVVSKMISGPIADGDEIVISTYKGHKSINFIRNGSIHNIISSVKKISSWFQLENGLNTFNIIAETGANNIYMFFMYNNAFGGV